MLHTFAFLDFAFPGLLISVIGVALLVFEVWMFINALQNPNLSRGVQILWLFCIVFFYPLAGFLYYFIAYQKQ